MDDLDEELEQLGYGNQWTETSLKIATKRQATNEVDVKRIQEYNQRYPERHKQAKAEWHKRMYEAMIPLVGLIDCRICNKKLDIADLLGMKKNPNTCIECRKKGKH